MRVFTVHIRRHGLDLDRDIAVVKEGFSWPAFLVGPLWALWHRHWLAALVLMAMSLAIAGLTELLAANAAAKTALSLGWSVFIGMFANDLRRALLERLGFTEVGIAAGRRAEDALLGFLQENGVLSNTSVTAPIAADQALP